LTSKSRAKSRIVVAVILARCQSEQPKNHLLQRSAVRPPNRMTAAVASRMAAKVNGSV
jgi:hypothetical protein